ncbi:hypothetical protein rpr22_CDSx678 [Rickettsia prowazekii str. Rp22]|uniref:Uncharacterized protein n=1 Tax=Rickettsia prowazekii (strain Rp22) TaxID=449216 RepID=D5AXN2_RICPP|nr:hypothetical protein rpr22_CDSx678 [Rickettsia prowazekii str. Rp22]
MYVKLSNFYYKNLTYNYSTIKILSVKYSYILILI